MGRKRGNDDEIIDKAIATIFAYNDAPGRLHDEKWFITANLLKKFTPKANQCAAVRGMELREKEIQEHHSKHQLRPDHNNRHKKHHVLDFVQI